MGIYDSALRVHRFVAHGVDFAIATVNSCGRIIFIADAHRDDGKRFVVHADEKLTAFLELESAIRAAVTRGGLLAASHG
jgi:hypothetical protein